MIFKFNCSRGASLVEYITALAIVFVVLSAGLLNLQSVLKNSANSHSGCAANDQSCEITIGPCGDLLSKDDCQ